MAENEIAKIIVDAAYRIHKQLGPGLFESVYESILEYELKESGLLVQRQSTLPVTWKEIKIDLGFKPDMIIENKVIIELKSVEIIAPVHYKQLLTYLRLTEIKLGLLIILMKHLLKTELKEL